MQRQERDLCLQAWLPRQEVSERQNSKPHFLVCLFLRPISISPPVCFVELLPLIRSSSTNYFVSDFPYCKLSECLISQSLQEHRWEYSIRMLHFKADQMTTGIQKTNSITALNNEDSGSFHFSFLFFFLFFMETVNKWQNLFYSSRLICKGFQQCCFSFGFSDL